MNMPIIGQKTTINQILVYTNEYPQAWWCILSLFDEDTAIDGDEESDDEDEHTAHSRLHRGDTGDGAWFSLSSLSLFSSSLLLLILLSGQTSPPPITKFFRRWTSDSCTGFARNSSAPSSRHLSTKQKRSPQLEKLQIETADEVLIISCYIPNFKVLFRQTRNFRQSFQTSIKHRIVINRSVK